MFFPYAIFLFPLSYYSTFLGHRCLSVTAARPAKIYELRTYDIKPMNMGEFMALTQENIHLRTQHSPLIGYWTTELGGINQVVLQLNYFHIKVQSSFHTDPRERICNV